MARIHMAIDIPKDGPAQVSITTEDDVLGARTPAEKPRPGAIAQASAEESIALTTNRAILEDLTGLPVLFDLAYGQEEIPIGIA